MDTLISIEIVGVPDDEQSARQLASALAWFQRVEECCTRFDERSEVMGLTRQVGKPVVVSPLLFQLVDFALAVARETDGAFDPTVGYAMERRGFNRNYRTGERVTTTIDASDRCSYRDVILDPSRREITLLRPLVLDLGAVAKGMAVDLAARELQVFADFAVDAGGDLFVKGTNADDQPWCIGIRHPRRPGALLDTLHVSNAAVCTSGDYERRTSDQADESHILDPRTGAPPSDVASVTVVAPNTMLADALATATFVLGLDRGIALLERHGVDGLLVTSSLDRQHTQSFARYFA